MGYEYQNAVFLAKSQKRFSNESRNNLIFIVHFLILPLSLNILLCGD